MAGPTWPSQTHSDRTAHMRVHTHTDTRFLSRVSLSSFTLSITVKMSFRLFSGSEVEERKVEVHISPSKKGAGR